MFIKLDTQHSTGDKVIQKYFVQQGDNRVQQERFGIILAVKVEHKVKTIIETYKIIDEEGHTHDVESHDLKKFIQ